MDTLSNENYSTLSQYIRDERTPGAVAVIQQTEDARANNPGNLPKSSGAAETNSSPSACTDNSTKIVGFGKLRSLLQPKHAYFEDKWGQIQFWRKYLEKSSGRTLVYPKVKTQRGNPYRKYQLNRQCSARAAKAVLEFAESRQLTGLKAIDMTSTMPKAMSMYLAGRADYGRKIAWDAGDRQWDKMTDAGIMPFGLARHSNLHVWASESPLEPHYHRHELVLNYSLIGTDISILSKKEFKGYSCPVCGGSTWLSVIEGGKAKRECANCYKAPEHQFIKDTWHRDKQNHLLVLSPDNLAMAKAIWLEININLAKKYKVTDCWQQQEKLTRFYFKNGLNGLYRLIRLSNSVNKLYKSRYEGTGLSSYHSNVNTYINYLLNIGIKDNDGKYLPLQGWIDMYMSYIDMRDDIGRAKFCNTLAYNGRSWEEDYAVYSNKNPDCAAPPAWLKGYSNKARLFGYWRDIKKLTLKKAKAGEIEKISPYTAEVLEYQGMRRTSEIIADAEKLIAVDFIRAKPIERDLSQEDIDWLTGVTIPEEHYGFMDL